MDTEGREIDELFIDELEKLMGGETFIPLPVAITIEQNDLPDIERWKKHG